MVPKWPSTCRYFSTRILRDRLSTLQSHGKGISIPRIRVCFTAPPFSCSSRSFSEAKNGAALPNHIYTDAMGFGMGCSCLQVTFQACNVTEARRIYDAFVPLAPIFVRRFRGSEKCPPTNAFKLALTAASPLWRGYIADVDARWNVIAGSVDDRTEEERGLKVRASWCEALSDSRP